jgi:hypothetical protein
LFPAATNPQSLRLKSNRIGRRKLLSQTIIRSTFSMKPLEDFVSNAGCEAQLQPQFHTHDGQIQQSCNRIKLHQSHQPWKPCTVCPSLVLTLYVSATWTSGQTKLL